MHLQLEIHFKQFIPLDVAYIKAFNQIEDTNSISQSNIVHKIECLQQYLNGCAQVEEIVSTQHFLKFIRADSDISNWDNKIKIPNIQTNNVTTTIPSQLNITNPINVSHSTGNMTSTGTNVTNPSESDRIEEEKKSSLTEK